MARTKQTARKRERLPYVSDGYLPGALLEMLVKSPNLYLQVTKRFREEFSLAADGFNDLSADEWFVILLRRKLLRLRDGMPCIRKKGDARSPGQALPISEPLTKPLTNDEMLEEFIMISEDRRKRRKR